MILCHSFSIILLFFYMLDFLLQKIMSLENKSSAGCTRPNQEPRSFLDAFTSHSGSPSTFPFFYPKDSTSIVSPSSPSTETFPLLSSLLSQSQSRSSLTVSQCTNTISSASQGSSSLISSHPPSVNPSGSALQHFSLAFTPPFNPNSLPSTRILFDIASSMIFSPGDVQSQLKKAINR